MREETILYYRPLVPNVVRAINLDEPRTNAWERSDMYKKLVLAIARIAGAVWLLIGIYGFVSALIVEENRLTLIALSVVFGGGGIWLLFARNPLRIADKERE